MNKIYSSGILVVLGLTLLFLAYFGLEITLGDIWYHIDSNSLVGLQRIVGEKLDPDPTNPSIYFKIILPILQINLVYIISFILFLLGIKNKFYKKNRSKRPMFRGRF